VDGRECTEVSVLDLALNYGDGLFETLRVRAGDLPLLGRHLERLAAGCRRIALGWPGEALLVEEAGWLAAGVDDGTLKLLLTRGDGGRGYAPPGGAGCRRILSLHAAPAPPAAGCAVGVCELRLGRNPALAGLKHVSRLELVLAAREAAERGWDEGLLRDQPGNVVEATRHNLFYVAGARLCTPPVDECGVAGVMRGLLLERVGGEIATLKYDELHAVEEAFLCNAVAGIRAITRLDGRKLAAGPAFARAEAELIAMGLSWAA
jgi:4-amino-4-deoxychorismate lyase